MRGRLPGQAVIQYTDRCNATCVQCSMQAHNKTQRYTMNPDDVKRALDAMAQRGVQSISFTGGEPLIYLKDIAGLMSYAGEAGIPFIRTGTNGFIFRNSESANFTDKIKRIADTLAETPVNTFWISLDSADSHIHEKNRGLSGIVKGIKKALPLFHERGLYPSANLGINRYTGGNSTSTIFAGEGDKMDKERLYQLAKRAFSRFYSSAEHLGFTIVNACYPMSLDSENAGNRAIYGATSEDFFIRFSWEEKVILFQALFDTIPEYRSRLRIFTPRYALHTLIKRYGGDMSVGYPCRGGIDFFFIDAKGMNTYPCGYRGQDNLGKFWDLDLKKLDTGQDCKLCDWECFRDPSDMAGPLLDLFSAPLTLPGKILKNRELAKIWLEDFRYYKACNFFNARSAPDRERMSRFVATK
ncbi:MAG: radical SAM protein [Proteobacteria bacterium]|nr:radical SAM protein [Pseudomonadota bacterium]